MNIKVQSTCRAFFFFAYSKTYDIFVTFAFIAAERELSQPHDGNSSEGPYPTSEKGNENRCLVFVSSIKHEIGKFHVSTVQ